MSTVSHHHKLNTFFSGASRDRTDDPLLARQMLSQLSYGPFPSLGLSRLELLTPRLSSVCSNQLSYRPSVTLELVYLSLSYTHTIPLSLGRRGVSRRSI